MDVLKVDVQDDIFVISDRKCVISKGGKNLWKCGIVFDGDNRNPDFSGKDFEDVIEALVGK